MGSIDKDIITEEQLERYNQLMIEAIKRISAENIRKIEQETNKKLKEYSHSSKQYSIAS